MDIQQNVPLAGYTTFGIGGPARWFVAARSEQDVREAVVWAEERGVPLFVLGGGSNLLVPDEGFAGLVLFMALGGLEQQGTTFICGAGVDWNRFVDTAVAAGCAGVECLAGIPGTVGGTPVQNVGAYGQEVSATIARVRVFDREGSDFRWLTNAECGFAYRSSIFNSTERNRYIVTAVEFHLSHAAPTLTYAELANRFSGQSPDLATVAATVRSIRRGKGMVIDPADPDSRSAGSFFKNPVVPAESLVGIAAAAHVDEQSIPKWPASPGRWKLPAAWLLERAGFVKGYGSGAVGISSKHTLALVNRGGATFADVLRLQQQIIAGVQQKFGVQLEREPVVLS